MDWGNVDDDNDGEEKEGLVKLLFFSFISLFFNWVIEDKWS